MEINTYIKNLMASASNLVGVVKNKQWERLDSQNWNLENALELLQKEIDENPEFSAISDPLEEQPDKGWIPVSERLPEVDGLYLCTQLETVGNSVYNRRTLEMWQNGIWLTLTSANITHWQPLPNPPQAPVKQG